MTILRGYRYRILAFAFFLVTLYSGLDNLSRGPKYLGSALLDFEWLSSFVGAYAGFAVARVFRSYLSDMVPGHKRTHLAAALGLQLFVIASCVVGAAFLSTPDIWGNVSYVRMFALLWGWSLLWFWGGTAGRDGLFIMIAVNLLLTAGSWRNGFHGVYDAFWPLMQGPLTLRDLMLPIIEVVFLIVLGRTLLGRRVEPKPTKDWTPPRAPSTLENLADDIVVHETLGARIAHLRFTLQKDYWVLSLGVIMAILLYTRYRGHLPFDTPYGPIYLWCFFAGLFMLPADVLKRKRLQMLFQLPLARREIIHSYGLMLLLTCLRYWVGFVVVSYFAYRIPILGESLTPPLEVWLYCLAILLIMFGVRTLLGSWDDRLAYRVIVVLTFVDFASAADWIPMPPVLAIAIGLAFVGASYFRWSNLEIE